MCVAIPPVAFLPGMLHTPSKSGTKSCLNYFILDVRDGATSNGKFPTSLSIGSETCNDVERLTALLANYEGLKGQTHVIVMGEGLEKVESRYNVALGLKVQVRGAPTSKHE